MVRKHAVGSQWNDAVAHDLKMFKTEKWGHIVKRGTIATLVEGQQRKDEQKKKEKAPSELSGTGTWSSGNIITYLPVF